MSSRLTGRDRRKAGIAAGRGLVKMRTEEEGKPMK